MGNLCTIFNSFNQILLFNFIKYYFTKIGILNFNIPNISVFEINIF